MVLGMIRTLLKINLNETINVFLIVTDLNNEMLSLEVHAG